MFEDKILHVAAIIAFLGFSIVKIHFLQNVLKNGLVSENNYFIFSPSRGGGGVPDPKVEFSTFFEPLIEALINLWIHIAWYINIHLNKFQVLFCRINIRIIESENLLLKESIWASNCKYFWNIFNETYWCKNYPA